MQNVAANIIQTNTNENVQYSGVPDSCPICHHAINPVFTSIAGMSGSVSELTTTLQMVYRCPRHGCGSYFIAVCVHPAPGDVRFVLKGLTPVVHRPPDVNSDAAAVSPTFKEIYLQAAAAEHYKLDQIAGVGYRKALEFLIKDYCIKESPSDEAAIKKELLGTTIKNRVSDPNIKKCAERAAWLGNDETHYERRWVDKDLADLKTLIQLTVHWIVSNVLTKKYLAAMPVGKP